MQSAPRDGSGFYREVSDVRRGCLLALAAAIGTALFIPLGMWALSSIYAASGPTHPSPAPMPSAVVIVGPLVVALVLCCLRSTRRLGLAIGLGWFLGFVFLIAWVFIAEASSPYWD